MPTANMNLAKGRQVLVGLKWIPCGEEEVNADVIRDYVDRHLSSGVVHWRSRTKNTLGLDTRNETDPLTPALALIALNHLQTNWVGIFELEGKYWLGASLNSHPYPLADRIFDGIDQKEALVKAFHEIRELINPSNIYAPPNFELEGAVEFDLKSLPDADSSMLVRNPEPSTLSRIIEVASLNQKKLIAAAALIIAGIGSFNIYQGYLEEQEAVLAKADAERLAVERKNEQENEQKRKLAEFKELWETQPSPAAHVEACRRGLRTLVRPVAGWDNGNQECAENTITVEKNRAWGADRRLSKLVDQWQATLVMKTTDQALVSVRWEQPSPRGPQDLLTFDQASSELRRWAAESGFEIEVRKPKDKGAIPGTNTTVFATGYALQGVKALQEAGQVLSHITGAGLLKITKRQDDWRLEGEIYHVE